MGESWPSSETGTTGLPLDVLLFDGEHSRRTMGEREIWFVRLWKSHWHFILARPVHSTDDTFCTYFFCGWFNEWSLPSCKWCRMA